MDKIQEIKNKIKTLNNGEKQFEHVELTLEEQQQRGKPKKYLEMAIDLFKAISGKTILEIGCMRQPMNHPISEVHHQCCNDGHSTYFWCTTGARVYSVDIDFKAVVRIAKKNIREFKNCHIFWQDGLKFLKKFHGNIDLLFLDAWDVVPGGKYAENHLLAYLAAKDKLSDRNIIIIDDTDVGNGGKGRLLLPVLDADGYETLVRGRQTITFKNNSS
ncbi:MAG: hypothetical protein SWC96_02335 [Thermodesulfobacteriota bacterium]|nr:hypothetical protein [Thermodesulfobacteriota bacterium]